MLLIQPSKKTFLSVCPRDDRYLTNIYAFENRSIVNLYIPDVKQTINLTPSNTWHLLMDLKYCTDIV